MTRVIWALIIVAVAFVGFRVYEHWVKINAETGSGKPPPVVQFSGDALPGMPAQLETSYRTARDTSPAAFRAWFNAHGKQISDPRKAWIELDLCVAVRRDNPAEAKAIYARLKDRVPPSSPVWPRLKELEKAFQ